MLTNNQKKELIELCVVPKEFYKRGMLELVDCITTVRSKWKDKYDNYTGSLPFCEVVWDLDKEEFVARHLLNRKN